MTLILSQCPESSPGPSLLLQPPPWADVLTNPPVKTSAKQRQRVARGRIWPGKGSPRLPGRIWRPSVPLCQCRVPDAEAELRSLTEPVIAELGEPSPAELRARPSASTKLPCLEGARAQQQAAREVLLSSS